jgi:hypothetical protein
MVKARFELRRFLGNVLRPDGNSRRRHSLCRPVDSAKNYIQLNSTEAARNAYTYAQFALHASKNADRRIVLFNE